MRWRRSTWALVLWNLIWLVLFAAWLLDPAPSSPGNGPGRGPTPIKPQDWAMFEYWVAGLAVLATVWFLTKWWARRSQRQVTFPDT
jgi:hypothetical protein